MHKLYKDNNLFSTDKKSRMSHADLNNNPLYYDSGHGDKVRNNNQTIYHEFD